MAGVIDASTVTLFQERLEQVRKDGVNKLILDISKIKYVNSTGLGSLVKFSDAFREAGGGIVLVRVPGKVRIVVEMLGLHEFFEMCATEQEAVSLLMGAPAKPVSAPPEPEVKLDVVQPPPAAAAEPEPLDVEPMPAIMEPEEIIATPVPAEPAELEPRAEPAPAPAPPAPPPAAPKAPPGPTKTSFPVTVTCITCSVDVEVPERGDFRCPRCSTFLSVDMGGNVNFSAPSAPLPIQMTLVSSPECTASFISFLRAMSNRLHVPAAAINSALDGVEEVLTKIARDAYDAKPATYHLLLVPGPDEIVLRTSDHGKAFDGSNLSTTFPIASKSFDVLELTPHPNGGNLVKMVKKIKK